MNEGLPGDGVDIDKNTDRVFDEEVLHEIVKNTNIVHEDRILIIGGVNVPPFKDNKESRRE